MITSAVRRRSPVCGLAVLSAAACSVLLISACSGGSPTGHPVATRSPPPATSGATASATPVATTEPGTPGAPIPPARALPRCRTGQLSTAFTGLNAAAGGQRGMTLILTPPDALRARMEVEVPRWKQLIPEIGLKVE